MARVRATDRRLFLLIEVAARRLNREADQRLKSTAHVTAAQAGVLFLLKRRGERRMGAIGEVLALNPPAVTGLISRMEAANLVHRRPDPDDKRSSVVTLSEAGRQAADIAETVLREFNQEIAERLGLDRADDVYDALTQLVLDEEF